MYILKCKNFNFNNTGMPFQLLDGKILEIIKKIGLSVDKLRDDVESN
jgi:hypothetical protein